MDQLDFHVDFPILSLEAQSENMTNNNVFMETDIGVNSHFIEEGPKESEMIANSNFFEETPMESIMTVNSIFEQESRAREMEGGTTIIEEGPRICPLCGTMVKLFFMNFREKLLMCENVECDFPFGYEDLQIVRVNTGVEFSEDMSTTKSTSSLKSKVQNSSGSGSIASWSDVHKVIQDADSGSVYDTKSTVTTASEREEKLRKQMKAKEKHNKILKHLKDIKKINASMKDPINTPQININNKKWLSNMKSLEEMSGVKLLTKKEKDQLQPQLAPLGMGEFKIDIGTANDNMTAIQIQITNTVQT